MQKTVGAWILPALAACATGGGSSPGSSAPSLTPTTAAVASTADTDADTNARIARLKRSFDCVDAPGTGAYVCSMKDGIVGSLVRKRIEPVVTSTGTISLRSVYRDRDWIYHDHVTVRVGGEVLRSEALPATSPDVMRREARRREKDREQSVAEQVTYRGGSDSGIVRAIAQAGTSAVTMQLAGGPRTYERALTADEKRLFAEAYELAQLLRQRAGTR